MNRDDFLKLFPRASESVIRANVTEAAPLPPARVQMPAKAKETKPARKKPTKQPAETSHEFYHRHSQTSPALLERSLGDGAMVSHEAQRGNPVRFLVRVTSFRRRLIDEDNLCEKYVVDCCRYAGLLPGDAPQTTPIEVSQQKVTREEDERTEVTIEDRGEEEPPQPTLGL